MRGGVIEGYIPHQPRRIRRPLARQIPIDIIPPKTRNLLPVHHLGQTTPRLRKLPRHPRDPDHGDPRAPDQHQAHLQQHLDLRVQRVLRAVVEQLRAVAALEEEFLAERHLLEFPPQLHDLVGGDEGGEGLEFFERVFDGVLVGVDD